MSMKNIFIILTILTYSCLTFAQNRYDGCVYLSAEKNGNSLDCTLHNETNDTIYLFCGYLKGAFSHLPGFYPKDVNVLGQDDYLSPYLRRYNCHYKTYTITYRPYLPLLYYKDKSGLNFKTDGQNVQYKCITFSLLGINPHASQTFRLPYKFVAGKEFVEDIFSVDDNHKTVQSKLSKIRNNQIHRYDNNTSRVIIEVTIYRQGDIGRYIEEIKGYPGFYKAKDSEAEYLLGVENKPDILNKFIPIKLTVLLSDTELD